jgi:signal transduction histidine kinase
MPFELPIRLDGIPQDVAICLYRVAQEILRNIATHAAAHKAQITSRSTWTHERVLFNTVIAIWRKKTPE